jgi:hypothetical protein
MGRGEKAAFSYQLSAISFQLLAVSYQLSAVSFQLKAANCATAAIIDLEAKQPI